MRRPFLFALFAVTLVACVRIPGVERRHPKSAPELLALAPECARPAAEAWEPCDAAGAILEADPRRATTIFASTWEHHVFDIVPDRRYSGVTPDPLGDAERQKSSARAVAAFSRVTIPALRALYARFPDDPFARAMSAPLDAIVLSSRPSLETFRKAALEPPRPTPTPDPILEL